MRAWIDFKISLKEIKYLTKNAIKFQSDRWVYQLYNKTSIILLITKFEVFVENAVDEYIFKCTKDNQTNFIPDPVKAFIELDLLSNKSKENLNNEKRLKIISNLIKLNNQSFKDLIDYDHSLKFNLGKHGEKEIRRMLSEIGIRIDQKPNISSILANFNLLNSIRNNIIHEDVNPNITHQEIIKFAISIFKLSSFIEEELNQNLNFV